MTAQPVIAVVDDDASVRLALGNLLQSFGFRAALFCDGVELLESDTLADVSCVLTDIQMPQMSGFALCDALRERGIGLPVIFMTAAQHGADYEHARARQAVCFLSKPFTDTQIIDCIARALGRAPCV